MTEPHTVGAGHLGRGGEGFIGVRSRCEPALEVGDWGHYNVLHSQSLIQEVNHEQNSKWMFKKCKLSTTRSLPSHQRPADCFPPSRISNWKFLLRRLETCSRVIIKTPPAAQFILSSQLKRSNLGFFSFDIDVNCTLLFTMKIFGEKQCPNFRCKGTCKLEKGTSSQQVSFQNNGK